MTQETLSNVHHEESPRSALHRPPHQPVPILPLHRECMAHFTGQWPTGYRPRWCRTPWWHAVTMLVTFGAGVTASALLCTASPIWWPLLLLSWMLTVHSSRKAQLVICHYAVHGNMTRRQLWDRVLTEMLSTLFLFQPYDQYYQEHVRTHHSHRLATMDDGDMQFLFLLGFRPGMSRTALWRQLYRTLGSPRFHFLFGRIRLKANFMAAPLYRRLLAGVYSAGLLVGLGYTQAWLPFMVAWILPIFPLYHIAALLQFTSEHLWLLPSAPPHSPRYTLGRLTFGRFVGDPLPHHALPLRLWLRAWGQWGSRFLFLHLPTRLCVLVGDLCQHDWHHHHIHGDWSNACYARQCDLAAGCPGWPEPYTEIWGLDRAIDAVFTGLASVPPLPTPPVMSPQVTAVVLGM